MQQALEAQPARAQRTRVLPGLEKPGSALKSTGFVHAMRSGQAQQDAPEQTETESERGDLYSYALDSEGRAHVVKCRSLNEELVIPGELDGHAVVALEAGSCTNQRLITSVSCPETLERIGAHAFEGCGCLESIALNEGLISVGEQAFALCSALAELDFPATLEDLGTKLTGNLNGKWSSKGLVVRIAADNPHLFIDENGIVYRREALGNAVVDGSLCACAEPVLSYGTVRVGEAAFAQNLTIRRIELPEGLVEIGASAFRGCTNLSEVLLPSTLETIGSGAFARAAVSRLALPAACTRIAAHGLNTGPVVEGRENAPYKSTLLEIEVDGGNPVYSMRGGLLCERTEEGLVALLCPAQVQEACIARGVVRVDATCFSGTSAIGTLRIHEDVAYARAGGLLPNCSCGRLVVERSDGSRAIELEIPEGKLGRAVTDASFSSGSVDVEVLLHNYDNALASVEEPLVQARQMLARLAHPVCLDAGRERAYRETVGSVFQSLCVHFGITARWEGFDHMIEAGLLDADGFMPVVALLNEYGDAPTVAHLLELKRTRFGKAVWDYEL